ncbi:hypothetical protein NDU88_006998 [Pleurodeles waltl]|uniref:Uncharacterized protein n=1 Tax=Pleurodeles waltl TaxID=8319 RepID=A0AAV7PK04_PLEWA|nr:hypothetical protein NDU88_006998 [Pleurodeles waltl]
MRRRSQRRKRGEGNMLWWLRQSTRSEAVSSDLEGSWNMVIWKRDRREDSALDVELAGSSAITGSVSGSPHPLVAVINQLETEEMAHGAKGDDKTVEAAL